MTLEQLILDGRVKRVDLAAKPFWPTGQPCPLALDPKEEEKIRLRSHPDFGGHFLAAEGDRCINCGLERPEN
jgi:hypothetical protein